MRVINVIKTAFKALVKNKMRSFLTALGIIIGVGAVISMISMGTGASMMVENQISSLGRDVIIVQPGAPHFGGRRGSMGSRTTLTMDDADAIARECSAVKEVSPMVRSYAPVIYGNMNWTTSVIGANAEYLSIRSWGIDKGKNFAESEIRGGKKVCLLGQDVVTNLFGDEDPLGKIIRIKKIPFKVIGVLSKKGQSMFGSSEDDIVIVPVITAQKRLEGITHVNSIFLSAKSSNLMDTAVSQIETLLRQRHKIREGKEDDFHVRNSAEIAEASNAIMTALTFLLAGIASVSLIVGGIGIMNIMLVSVVERTREIGIRMAVGARPRDILRQFLIEAVVLSCAGGILGILFGIGIALFIQDMADWPTFVSFFAIILAFVFSAGVGIFFGFYPAMKASKLDPIEALRYE